MADKEKTPSWVAQAKQEAQDNADREKADKAYEASRTTPYKKGGKVKKMAKGGTASSRADGIAERGKTKGRLL